MRRQRSWASLGRLEITAAVALALLSLATLYSEHLDRSQGITRKADLLGVALVLATTLPLAVAHARPRSVTLVTFATGTLAAALGYATGPAPVAPVLALGIAAYFLDRLTAAALGVAAGTMVVAALAGSSLPINHSAGALGSNLAVIALVTLLGMGLRVQREYARALEARTRELEQLREVETREAIAQERLRIARELHDIVGHALAAITLHAQLARRRLSGGDPELVAEPLDEIIELSGGALAQTRDTVSLMRGDRDPADLGPPPTLDRLDDLIAGLRNAGARIELISDGAPVAVPIQVQCAGYRIVQEALSNFLKHAPAASAVVALHRTPAAVIVEVQDDGAAAAQPVQVGSGIRGMRERASAVGGRLEVGALPEGGWAVKATLPIARTLA